MIQTAKQKLVKENEWDNFVEKKRMSNMLKTRVPINDLDFQNVSVFIVK